MVLSAREKMMLQRLDSSVVMSHDGSMRINVLQIRFALLQGLNQRLRHILPYVDLSTGLEYRMGHKLRRLGYCIFYDLKMDLLDTALRFTAQNSGNIPLNLDHQKKTLSSDCGNRDPGVSQCVFVQAFQQTQHVQVGRFNFF